MSVALTHEDKVSLSPAQVDELAALLGPEQVRAVHLDTARGRFCVTWAPAPPALQSVAGATETVRADVVGEFLAGHPGRGTPLVSPGDRVQPGHVLGLVRTGPLLSAVVFEGRQGRAATVLRSLQAPGTLVGYGTPLFELAR